MGSQQVYLFKDCEISMPIRNCGKAFAVFLMHVHPQPDCLLKCIVLFNCANDSCHSHSDVSRILSFVHKVLISSVNGYTVSYKYGYRCIFMPRISQGPS